jgi:outer membrane protein
VKINTYLVPALALGMVAAAQAQPPAKIGVIQIQVAMTSTKDGQKAVADFDAKLEPQKKDLEKKQSELRDLQEKLQRGGNALSETNKADLTRTIDQKTKSYQRDVEDFNAEAEQEQNRLLQELGPKMKQVIDKFGEANGYSVILDVSNPNGSVFYASNAVDVTKEIIDLYDKTVSSSRPATPSPKPAPSTAAPKSTPATPPAPKKQP